MYNLKHLTILTFTLALGALWGCTDIDDLDDIDTFEVMEGASMDISSPEQRGVSSNQHSPFDIALDELDSATVQRAEYHLNRYRDTPSAPTWSSEAALGDVVRALYLPDMEEPAYYEFSVNEGGYLIIATGQHDAPMTNLSYKGTRVTQRLIDQAKEAGALIGRMYKMGSLSYAAENERGDVVAELGLNYKPTHEEWIELKSRITEGNLKRPESFSHKIAKAWNNEQNAFSIGISFQKNMTVPLVIRHEIYRPDVVEKVAYSTFQSEGCSIGCGPIAWGIVTAYMDFIAETDSSWSSSFPYRYRNIMKAGMLMTGGPIEAQKNYIQTERAENMMRGIRNTITGACIPGFGMTAVLPHDMGRYANWANIMGASLTVDSNLGSLEYPVTFARKKIADGFPVVLGLCNNWSQIIVDHYVVATRYQKSQNGEEFYVNYGFTGTMDDQYISSAKVLYSAAAVPIP